MSAQQISRRRMNRIEKETGQKVLRAWSLGGPVMGFITPNHAHGWYDLQSGDWGWDEDPTHYSFCQRWERS